MLGAKSIRLQAVYERALLCDQAFKAAWQIKATLRTN